VATVLDDVGWTAVPAADGADVIVVRENDAWALAPDTSTEAVDALDATRHLWRVRADGELEPLPGEGTRAFNVVAVALAAESVGVARRAMDMAVQYAKEREQFGRPIGAYQAVSHACAQMLLEVEGARSTTLYAAWALDHEPESGPLAASMAKAYASDAGWRVPASALQVHGGIGFTWEHDLHLWLKRGKANAYLWGDARAHRDRVADSIGL
jgi:alkylation response protein AidB-like acyl-CoA dehydrogenase